MKRRIFFSKMNYYVVSMKKRFEDNLSDILLKGINWLELNAFIYVFILTKKKNE